MFLFWNYKDGSFFLNIAFLCHSFCFLIKTRKRSFTFHLFLWFCSFLFIKFLWWNTSVLSFPIICSAVCFSSCVFLDFLLCQIHVVVHENTVYHCVRMTNNNKTWEQNQENRLTWLLSERCDCGDEEENLFIKQNQYFTSDLKTTNQRRVYRSFTRKRKTQRFGFLSSDDQL